MKPTPEQVAAALLAYDKALGEPPVPTGVRLMAMRDALIAVCSAAPVTREDFEAGAGPSGYNIAHGADGDYETHAFETLDAWQARARVAAIGRTSRHNELTDADINTLWRLYGGTGIVSFARGVLAADLKAAASRDAIRDAVLEEAAIECDLSAQQYGREARGGDNSGASDHKGDAACALASDIRALKSAEAELRGAVDTRAIDYSLKAGDVVRSEGWDLSELICVDFNWALRAVALKLGKDGDIVVWPVAGLVKS